jgi:hypothetical protein
MSLYTVNVSNISPSTTEAQLKDYFALCGKIASIDYSEKEHTAKIAFEKGNATQTALMLNDANLDGATLNVTSGLAHQDEHRSPTEESCEQSDKPRAGIAAEYLAKGDILSDHILQRAIEMDNKQGISKQFLSYFHSLDKSVGKHTLGPDQTISGKLQSTVDKAVQQARTIDEEKGYSKTVHDYYLKAIMSPLGQRVRMFYTDTSKQVQDIHEEARRIVDHEKEQKLSATSKPTTTQPEGTSAVPGSASEPENKSIPVN